MVMSCAIATVTVLTSLLACYIAAHVNFLPRARYVFSIYEGLPNTEAAIPELDADRVELPSLDSRHILEEAGTG